MKNIRTETWDDHQIRFVEKEPGDWWAVAADVAKALGYKHTPHMLRILDDDQKDVRNVDTPGGSQEMSIVSEFGIYAVIMRSRRKEAIQFQKWVYNVIRELRQSTGLEGFQIFRMLDKEHQKEAMSKLKAGLRQPARVDFIKANTIANKAVSSKFGYPKMLKKNEMPPQMLVEREPILEDTVELMSVVDRFELPISVSETIYRKHVQ
jgi:prophage antirepressor-like protein